MDSGGGILFFDLRYNVSMSLGNHRPVLKSNRRQTQATEATMKTLIHLIIAAMLVVGLSGCATTAATEPAKVKCPACHYEFTPPAVGP
jgi:hypothetical protein